MKKNPGLKDQALADAIAKQPWDPSIQGLAPFPDVVEKLAENIQWTSDLGNAFLAQQPDVMAAVQRMRAKAQGTGTLKTSAQQKVETQTVEGGQQAIVIQPADPSVVYVPSYDPATVYGAPAYPIRRSPIRDMWPVRRCHSEPDSPSAPLGAEDGATTAAGTTGT